LEFKECFDELKILREENERLRRQFKEEKVAR
jgi:hypothetical protein